jgi:hypothetical protein
MYFLGSHNEITAAKMLLDKANLTGYQVTIRTSSSFFYIINLFQLKNLS